MATGLGSCSPAWLTLDDPFSPDSEAGDTTASITVGNWIASLVEAKYQELTYFTALTEKHRKVLAAVVMETREELKVVALGTGTKCISGMNLDESGCAINDCHAEVIARRAFVGFLYSELEKFTHNTKGSIFVKQHCSELLGLRPDVFFHLYISHIPCGDAAVFGTFDDCPDLKSKQLQRRGRARAKIDMGEGAVYPPATPQVWDKIRRGSERLFTSSCSDKLARWNLLGMQGSLLSIYLDPIYISTVTIGNKFSHTHLHRAVSGRIKAITHLPRRYSVSSPTQLAGSTASHITAKSVDMSLNWSMGLAQVEKVNCRTGRKEITRSRSRLCKHSFFEEFLKLWDVRASWAAKTEAAEVIYLKTGIHVHMAASEHLKTFLTYGEVKSLAIDHGITKAKLLEHYVRHCGGPWARKPPEQDSFMLKDTTPMYVCI